MGGVAMAVAHDSLSVFKNPSQCAQLADRLDLGVGWSQAHKQLEIRNREPFFDAITQEGRLSAACDNQYYPELGVNLWVTCDLALGIVWNEYQHIATHYNTQLTDFSAVSVEGVPLGTNALLDYDVEVLTGNAAYHLHPHHAIGVGVNVYSNKFKINGLERMLQYSSDPDHLTNQGTDRDWAVGWTLGWMGHFSRGVSIAFSYSPRVKVKFGRYKGFLAQHQMDLPAVTRAGIAYRPVDSVHVALDAEYRNYGKSFHHPFIGDSTSGIGPLFGQTDGPGFGWSSQWLVSVGVEWAVTPCLDLRMGYRHESPVLRGSGTRTALNVFTLATVENYLTVGATWYASETELTIFGEAGLPHRVNSRYPSNFSGVTVNFLGGDLTFKSQSYRAGMSYGIRF